MALAAAALLTGCGVPSASSTAAPSPAVTAVATETSIATAQTTSGAPTAKPTLPPIDLPEASRGCAEAHIDKGGDSTITIRVDGVDRTALVHVPPPGKAGAARPLVLSFHGTAGDPAGEAAIDGLRAIADAKGFVVAYPAGVGDPPSWSYTRFTAIADDVPFVTALLDQLGSTFCLDPRRTFAAGMSAGAAFSKVLACRLPDRIAGVMLVAGVYGPDFGDCLPGRPMPTLVFHGVLDPLTTWHGARIPIPLFDGWPPTRDVLDWAGEWAANNGCAGEPISAEPVGWATEITWQACTATTVFYRLDDAGHTWPGSEGPEVFGQINHDVSASQLGWEFFAAVPPLGG
jgi:polyhydroxybutyrate depolymerase